MIIISTIGFGIITFLLFIALILLMIKYIDTKKNLIKSVMALILIFVSNVIALVCTFIGVYYIMLSSIIN